MGWVLRTEPEPVHECAPPMAIKELTIEQADGTHGDLWRCDDCRKLWVLFVNSWQWAGLWLRIRHRRDGYPPKPPYDVTNDDGSVTHYSSEREREAGWAAVYTVPPRATVAPPSPPPSGARRTTGHR